MRCTDCGDYEKLFRSVARSKAWVKACIALLQQEHTRRATSYGIRDERLEEIFAVYFLELYTIEEAPGTIMKGLTDTLVKVTGLLPEVVKEIIYTYSQREISSQIYPLVPKEQALREEWWTQLDYLQLYSPKPNVSLETLLRYELIKKAWHVDWSLCSGTVFAGIPTYLGNIKEVPAYYSLFPEDAESAGVLTSDITGLTGTFSTVLSHSVRYNEMLVRMCRALKKNNPDINFVFLSEKKEEYLFKDYWRISLQYKPSKRGDYIVYVIGNGEENTIKQDVLKRLPPVPLVKLDFENMFAKLQEIAANPPVDWARSYYNNDTEELVNSSLAIGLVKRSYPGDYYESDVVSDVFSYRARMRCHTTDRYTGKQNPSPAEYWNTHRLFVNQFIEKNNIKNYDALEQVVYERTKACTIFSAGLAVYIYRKYGGKNSRVLDGFAGWTERMVAAAACGCREYTGYDTNTEIPYGKAIETLQSVVDFDLSNYTVENTPFQLADLKQNHYDISLLSPPFFEYEIYTGEETSTTRYRTLGEWIEGFWKPSLRNVLAAMRRNGWIILYLPAGQDETAVAMHDAVEDVFEHGAFSQGTLGFVRTTTDSAPKLRHAIVFRKL